jgi:catechol 2,3-dioxygenase-like lactoylglutathione lyase family enzyme
MIDAISRIRIAIPDLVQGIAEYSQLVQQQPVWRGLIKAPGLEIGAAWFALANTLLELYESPEAGKARITGLVFRCNDVNELDLSVERTSVHYCRGDESVVAPWWQLGSQQARGLDVFIEQGELQQALLVDVQQAERPVQSIDRVDHVVLYTADADDCIQLFGEQGLGIRLALDQTVPEWGGRMVFFRTGKLTLEIIAPDKGLPGEDYFWGIAYQSADLDRLHADLTTAGVQLSPVRKGRKPGTLVASVKSHDMEIPTLLVEPRR